MASVFPCLFNKSLLIRNFIMWYRTLVYFDAFCCGWTFPARACLRELSKESFKWNASASASECKKLQSFKVFPLWFEDARNPRLGCSYRPLEGPSKAPLLMISISRHFWIWLRFAESKREQTNSMLSPKWYHHSIQICIHPWMSSKARYLL